MSDVISGETKSTHLEVIVQFRPAIISLTKSSYKTGRGLAGELTCLINGEPEPKVTWYKGNEVVHLDDRITSEHAGNRHILLISRLRADDVATYMCYTINELGSAQKTVQIQHEDITEQSVFSASTENTIASTAEQETIIEEVDKDQDETGIPVESENHWNNMEFLESFKQKIESDINTLRNLTYRAISQSQSKSTSPLHTVFENHQKYLILQHSERSYPKNNGVHLKVNDARFARSQCCKTEFFKSAFQYTVLFLIEYKFSPRCVKIQFRC